MSSKLLVNLVEPSDIVVPDTDGTTPDTGMFSISGNVNDILSNNNIILVTAITALVLLVASVVIILLARHHKKHTLMHGFSSYTSMKLNTKRHLIPKLAGLSFIILVSVFGILKFNDSQRMANAETMEGPALTITTEEITAIDIEMDDEAVFGAGESKITVTTATENGYTLMAYVDSKTTSLANESGDAIEMLKTSQSQALTDNTWGMSLSKPNSQEETLFRGLPTTEEDAMVVKVAGNATEVNDETTLYYGTYVTSDLDYGTYEGVTINYIAIPHVTTNDDVTVRYHGNGFYFDEAKTKDTNTVVYGDTCKMEYIGVGGGCTTIYVDEENAKISKTPLIDDEGVAEYEFGYYSDSVYVDSVSFEGADLLKVELNYGVEDWYDFLYVFEGAHDESEGDYWFVNEDKLTIINDGQYDNGMATFYVDSDAITFVLTSDYSGAYYGYYATVMPVYYEQPSGTETVEDKLCQFVKSNNVDDDGEIIESYSSDYYSLQAISIPRASKVKVEVEYAITSSSAWIGVIEGVFAGDWDDEPRDFVSYEIYSEENNISGTNEYIINGSIVTFEMELWNEPVEGYDYGFYAKLYPIYDEEHEGTTTTQICSYGVKEGEYLLPLANNWYEEWYYEYENEETNENIWESFEFTDEIVDYVYGHPEFFPGNIIDVYAYDTYYRIVYDGNGGVAGEEEDVGGFWIYNDDSKSIWDNWFENAGYEFAGWNTKPDGSGDWYYPGNIIYSDGHLGETLTLYAQWEENSMSSISDLTYMQDFATLSADEKNVVLQSMTLNQQYELKDIRDNKTYTIAKLADGNVWMTQNLDHDIVTTNNFYTYANTDIGHGSTPNTSATWTASTATYAANDTTWDNTTESSKSYDPGDLCWNGIIGEYTIATGATTCGNNKHYHIGNYYSWNAAIAINDSSPYTTDAEDVDQSICPAGWRLPSFNPNEGLYSGKSYENLVADLNLTFGTSGNIQNAPVYFTYGGYWYGSPSGSLRSFGEVGRYWTSNAFTDHGVRAAFAFHFISSGSHGMVGDSRYSGNSVRCVAR